jgi:hypothetical protein
MRRSDLIDKITQIAIYIKHLNSIMKIYNNLLRKIMRRNLINLLQNNLKIILLMKINRNKIKNKNSFNFKIDKIMITSNI